jgi:hypothetical protein
MAGRALASVVAALICLGAVAGGTAGATAEKCGVEHERTAHGVWSLVPLPAFEHGPLRQEINDVNGDVSRAVDYAIGSRRLYIADQWSIYESTDDGCSWRRSFDVARDAVPNDGEAGVMKIVAIGTRGSNRAETAYALIDDAGTPLLATKWAGAGEWTLTAVTSDPRETPVLGTPEEMWLSTTGRTVYVLVDAVPVLGVRSSPRLYGSDDRGKSWSLRHIYAFTGGLRPRQAGDVTCALGPAHCLLAPPWVMAVDAVDPNILWTSADAGIFRSSDGGLTWKNVYPANSEVLGEVGAIVVDRRPHESERVVAFGTAKLAWSDDAGKTWRLVDAPRGVDSAGQRHSSAPLDSAAVGDAGAILVAHIPGESFAGTNVQLLSPGGEWTDVAPPMLECPRSASEGAPPDCVTRLSYAAGRGSFYGITVEGTALIAFRPAR